MVAVDAALAGRVPIVSRQAVREFLVKGDKQALREFLTARGGSVALPGTKADVAALVQRAQASGRSTKIKDIRVGASAQAEGVPVTTRDQRFTKMLNAFGIGAEGF